MSQCPKCGSANIDIVDVEEDCWSYGSDEGHYTRSIGLAGQCFDCDHEWDAAPEDDGPDPEDLYNDEMAEITYDQHYTPKEGI